MSRKSRRHGRHLSRSKRRKFRKGFYTPPQPPVAAPQPSAVAPQPSAVAPQPPAVAQQYEPEPRAEAVAPPVRAPAPRSTVTLPQFPRVTNELRMIGILSGIILVILIVLAFVLP
jgi:hypothetical protein